MKAAEIKSSKDFSEKSAELKEARPYPPCRAACPVHTDVQAYVADVAEGRYTDAFEVIRSVNPIASACSLICHHPCEQQCRRCGVDEPLGVRHLKRFALEQATDYRRSKRHAIPQTKGKSVAIIGSGPAGLTAANDLADLGYKVTIFEKNPTLGGMLSAAIPAYRLPRVTLQEDIDDVLAKGVEAKTDCEIGKDFTLAELSSKYNAVLLATGLSLSRSINIPGVDAPGVLLALPFLSDAAYERKVNLGKKVLVIGGGNVAIDVARTAKRLGAENVEMVCLESEEEMPAWDWEVDEACEEGIKIHYRWGPKAVKGSGEKLEGLEVVKVTSVFDESGRFSPKFDQNQTTLIEAETIIIAIGQMSDFSFLKDSAVKIDERGRLVWSQATHMSSAPGVFVSGEVVTGPGSAIAAASSGHRVAKAIDLHLSGKNIEAALLADEKAKIGDMPQDIIHKLAIQPRGKVEHIDANDRCTSFIQFEAGYDEYTALREARRCRSCGGGAVVNQDKCVACLTCLRVCPYDAPVVTNKAEISPDRCQACGLCVPVCPCQAITMVGYDINAIRNNMPSIIGDKGVESVVVAFMCSHYAAEKGASLPSNVRKVRVHCTSRVDVHDMLSAFESGADGAFIVFCGSGDCRYREVYPRVKMRAELAKKMLGAVGINPERLGYFRAGSEAGDDWVKALEDMAGKLKEMGK